VTVAERMRKDGWRECPYGFGWNRNEAGLRMFVYRSPARCAEVYGEYRNGIAYALFVPFISFDATLYGVFDLAQRAKSAARRLARKGRKP